MIFSDAFRPVELGSVRQDERKVYAFDVDECLETSNGPVTVSMLKELRKQGHVVGLCGALCRFVQVVPDWHDFISFTLNFDFGYEGWYARYGLHSHIPKEVWLHCFQHVTFPNANEYVMVGNVFGEMNSKGFKCGSRDNEAAAAAGWRFIKEDDFARGVR